MSHSSAGIARVGSNVSDDEAAAFLSSRFGIKAVVAPLSSERDQVFAVTRKDGGKAILRISAVNELLATIQCQNGALTAVTAADSALPVPHLIPSLLGGFTEWMDCGESRRAVRLFTFLEGVPVGKVARVPGQLGALGTCLARLDEALSHFESSSGGAADVWDMENAPQLASHLDVQPDPAIREPAQRAISWFAEKGRRLLRELPRQFIHNDFGPKNVLVDRDNPTRVTAIIDFGDMLSAPRIVDLAVGIAKLVGFPDPLAEACEMVRGYASRVKLSRQETAVLFRLVCTRLAMRIAVWSRRQAEVSVVDASETITAAAVLLQKFEQIGEERATEALLEAGRV